MLYLLAIFLPPVAVLIAGKPFQALINVGLTLLFWVPGMIHAFMVVANHYADRRTDRIERAIMASAPPAPPASLGSVPVFPKPDIGARAIASLAVDGPFESHETRGIFTRVVMGNGATGWVRTADIHR